MGAEIFFKIKKSITRRINQMHSYDYPEQTKEWKKYKNNPVLSDPSGGSLFDPFVRVIDGNYKMCLSRRYDHSIMMFSSEDGFNWNWNDGIKILDGNSNSTWQKKVNRACFIFKDDLWHLWYTGQSEDKSRIGYAISKDGKNYTRMEIPVLIPEYDWEGDNVMNPCVLWNIEKNCYQMWYAAGENYEPDVIGYAESSDGKIWAKHDVPVLKANENLKYCKEKVGACDVIYLGDRGYLMSHIAYQNINVARIAIAYSEDGINNWTYLDEPIISPGKGKWDGHAVYKPTFCLDKKDNSIILWYNGRLNHKEQIGIAVSNNIL